MKSHLLGVAIAMVRAWTRIYTWRLPPTLRESRRAEIESDLWESRHDTQQGLSPAVQVATRLLLGIPDDLQWRLAHASVGGKSISIVMALAATVFLLAALWLVDLLKARRLPVPPAPPLVTPAPVVSPPFPPAPGDIALKGN